MPAIIPHNQPTIDPSDVELVSGALQSHWIAPGERTREFETELVHYLKGKGDAIAVESGTAALHLALNALDVHPGDEVILPTYVCSAVLNAVNYTGATPVLADIDPYTLNLSYEDTARRITGNTRAIIIPHMYGTPIEIEPFRAFGIPIIEDCAQSIGASVNGRSVGTFGDLAIFSFYATKMLTTAKGGAVYSQDKDLIAFIRDLVDFDCRPSYKVRYNYRLSDLQAALGLSQLKKLHYFINRRQAIADRYRAALEQTKQGSIIETPRSTERVWYRFLILSNRDPQMIQQNFAQKGITVINPLENWELLHNYLNLEKSQYPNAEEITQKTVSVPIYPSLTNEEITQIEQAIKSIYGGETIQ